MLLLAYIHSVVLESRCTSYQYVQEDGPSAHFNDMTAAYCVAEHDTKGTGSMFKKVFGRMFALIAMLAVVASTVAMPASAETTTIYADLGRCRTNFEHFQIQLQSRNMNAPVSDFPTSVTLTFADGSVAEATPDLLEPNFGTLVYRLTDPAYLFKALDSVSAQFDASKYPNYRFTVTARACDVTSDLTGSILQHGNGKPVEGLSVCLQELAFCTSTDAAGEFSFAQIPNGVYTLVSDAPVYKTLTTQVVVDGDKTIELVQYRGGGKN